MAQPLADLMLSAVFAPVTWRVSWSWPDDVKREHTPLPLAEAALWLAQEAASWSCYSITIERCGGPGTASEVLL